MLGKVERASSYSLTDLHFSIRKKHTHSEAAQAAEDTPP